MSRLLAFGAVVLAAGIAVAAQTRHESSADSALFDRTSAPRLVRFASARAFDRFLRSMTPPPQAMYDMAPPAVNLPSGELPSLAPADEAGALPGNPEITNNQTVGVDEGGIVKQVGRFLVVLQDGRLFSADLGDGGGAPLRLADRVDVYRSAERAASWYDEMLVLGDRILITAYDYAEAATEISAFRIDAAGRMRREGRFLLSSDDYYSTENYATRLVGDNLVFYAPLSLERRGPDDGLVWPRIRRAAGDGEADEGDALIGPTDVYAPIGEVDWPVLHTVSVCPLRRAIACRTTAFVGASVREFYVSPDDAFLWIDAPDGRPWAIDYASRRRRACPDGHQWSAPGGESAILYRLPLDGGPIGAVAVDGVPADQFAFDSRDGRFRALLQRTPPGCVKADAGVPLALLDLPLTAFGGRVRHVADAAYAALPAIDAGLLENRFVGRWLVYGGRSGESDMPAEAGAAPAASSLVAVPLGRPAAAIRLRLPHNAIRIERAGGDAVVTGYRDAGGLDLSYVSLGGAQPRLAATVQLPRRFESEGRSHAFGAWLRADGSGLIGLPTTLRIRRAGRGWSDSETSDLSFVAVGRDKSLRPAGELAPRPRQPSPAYVCEASCVDWYGNSRPIFTGGRIFALMGTDLVEGRIEAGRIGETARLDLTAPPRRTGP